MPAPVITVSGSWMDGVRVAWHRTADDATNMRPILTATRTGVWAHASLVDIPTAWITVAREAHFALTADRNADLGHLATHRNDRVPNGPLVPAGTRSGGGE